MKKKILTTIKKYWNSLESKYPVPTYVTKIKEIEFKALKDILDNKKVKFFNFFKLFKDIQSVSSTSTRTGIAPAIRQSLSLDFQILDVTNYITTYFVLIY